MKVDIHGYKDKSHMCHVSGDLDFDELMDVVVSPKAYLNAVHPHAKARGVNRAFAVIHCTPNESEKVA